MKEFNKLAGKLIESGLVREYDPKVACIIIGQEGLDERSPYMTIATSVFTDTYLNATIAQRMHTGEIEEHYTFKIPVSTSADTIENIIKRNIGPVIEIDTNLIEFVLSRPIEDGDVTIDHTNIKYDDAIIPLTLIEYGIIELGDIYKEIFKYCYDKRYGVHDVQRILAENGFSFKAPKNTEIVFKKNKNKFRAYSRKGYGIKIFDISINIDSLSQFEYAIKMLAIACDKKNELVDRVKAMQILCFSIDSSIEELNKFTLIGDYLCYDGKLSLPIKLNKNKYTLKSIVEIFDSVYRLSYFNNNKGLKRNGRRRVEKFITMEELTWK